MDERIERHKARAAKAGRIARAAQRLETFHLGIARELEKLADAAQGCTGPSSSWEESAGPSPAAEKV